MNRTNRLVQFQFCNPTFNHSFAQFKFSSVCSGHSAQQVFTGFCNAFSKICWAKNIFTVTKHTTIHKTASIHKRSNDVRNCNAAFMQCGSSRSFGSSFEMYLFASITCNALLKFSLNANAEIPKRDVLTTCIDTHIINDWPWILMSTNNKSICSMYRHTNRSKIFYDKSIQS